MLKVQVYAHDCYPLHPHGRVTKVPARARSAAVHTCEAPRKYLTLPTVSYSNLREDIKVNELRRLYTRVLETQDVADSTTKQSFFQHWQVLSDEEASHKLQLLLDNSVAVAAAFVRGSVVNDDDDTDAAASSSEKAVSSAWGRWGWRQPKRLVGFVRAAGDTALAATIHDLVIHPDLQGYGLGAVLLTRVVNQIAGQGVFDVGLAAPSNLQSFFRSCSFELDREESVPMALQPGWNKLPEEINAPLQQNPALRKLLLTAMDDKQRQLSTAQ